MPVAFQNPKRYISNWHRYEYEYKNNKNRYLFKMDNFSSKPRRADEGYVVKTNYRNSQKKVSYDFHLEVNSTFEEFNSSGALYAYILNSNETYLIVK